MSDPHDQGLWDALRQAFETEPATTLSIARKGENLGLKDEVAQWLVDKSEWPLFGWSRDEGRLYVECPWKAGHSMDSGDTEAAWLVAGSSGVVRGHFKCLHATCAGKSSEDFQNAVGYVASGFDVVEVGGTDSEPDGTAVALDEPWPLLRRRPKTKVILNTIGNVVAACTHVGMFGRRVRYDTFLDELMVASPGTEDWRSITEDDPIQMRVDLETRGFESVGPEMMRHALILVGSKNKFDTAQVWLEGLPAWDGEKRCERFFIDYMPGGDDAYGLALGRYVWSAHAGRVMEPGCQVDITPLLIGAQGIGKTRGVRAISPDPKYVCEIGFHEKDDDKSRKMRGALVCELAELRGLNSRDAEEIKAFMSKKVESWIPKYCEKKTHFGRRLVFWGTSNEDDILADPTGERRWAPRRVDGAVSVEAIERDRLQLWAEGLAIYRDRGVAWQETERLAAPEHSAFKVPDMWEDRILEWLDETDTSGKRVLNGHGFKSDAIAVGLLGFDLKTFKRSDEMRIGKILRANGYVNTPKWVDGRAQRLWFPKG